MLPVFVIECNIEPTVTKEANNFISFKFGDAHLLGIVKFFGGGTSLEIFFLKAYKTSETKDFFPFEWFDHPDRMQSTDLPPYDSFYSKLRSCYPLEAEYTE